MKTRETLIRELNAHRGEEAESIFLQPMLHLLQQEERCFYRDCFCPGHVTGSGFLLNRAGDKVLMNHHRALGIWVCFGGHADGDEDISAAAQREVIEESGIESVRLVMPQIFDIDIHNIPENPQKGEPAHQHFDITFLFQTSTDHENFVQSAESVDLRWCNLEEAQQLSPHGKDPHMDRLFRKWQLWAKSSL